VSYMARKPRKAPKLDPLDEFSTWNRRIARTFFLATVIGTLVVVIGIWVTIVWYMAEEGLFTWFEGLDISFIIAIIIGLVAFHLFLLILFYILFKGGRDKLLKVLFKDRKLAKKYEDYSGLRILVGLLLWALFLMIVSLIIAALPAAFGQAIATVFDWMIRTFNPGQWILWVGAVILIGIGIIFMLFVLWNNGVYWVLKRVKIIEEEREIKEEIDKETLKKMSDKEMHDVYEKETGRNSLYRNKETSGFKKWKKKRLS